MRKNLKYYNNCGMPLHLPATRDISNVMMTTLCVNVSHFCERVSGAVSAKFVVFEAQKDSLKAWRTGGTMSAVPILPFTVAGPLICDLFEGVVFLHDNNIVHLDMKLDNLFIRRDGGLAIGDLGEAKMFVRL